MDDILFDRIPSPVRKTLIKAYGELVERIWNDTLCELYLVVIMFNHLSRIHGPVLDQMVAESEHFYRGVLLNSERKPKSVTRQDRLPIMLGHPDLPVRKADKVSVADVRINDGLHMNFMLARPIASKVPVPLGQLVRDNPTAFYGNSGLKRRIHVERVEKTPAKAAVYVMKFLGRSQFGLDHVFIMPKALSELPAETHKNTVQLKWE